LLIKIKWDLFTLKNDGFVKVANTSDIPVSKMKEVQVSGQNICLANINGKYFAINNICSHEGGPLADGRLEGYEVECPWHQSKFDMRTGQVRVPPAVEPQVTYQVKVEGENVLIKAGSVTTEVKTEVKGVESSNYKLILKERQVLEGTDILSLKFNKQAEDNNRIFDYVAGQFAFFDIGEVYDDPKGPIRHFTLASSPTEEFILISTRIRDSPYKKKLDSLQIGTTVKVCGPQGKFTLHEEYSNPAIFLSGGIGVTPFRSMIKYATDKNLHIRIIMLDSNRSRQNILFKNDFDKCADTNKSLKIVYTITEEQKEQNKNGDDGWKGEKGRIDVAMLKRYLNSDDLEKGIFYICGPPAMVKAMQDILEVDLQIPAERIKIEEFTGY
jgi:ferredoxin-NADP reductase/nitrite reductase/ring-hydroxylating ferredoxin subunit